MNAPDLVLSMHQTTLSRFVEACRSDPRVLAAYLYGSHASGTSDAWSDLDLGLVLAGDAFDDFAAGLEAFLRQLGEPLFIEDFDSDGVVFFILAGGTEGELAYGRAGEFTEPHGPWRPLLDKAGALAAARPRPRTVPADQIETLRRQITWFWHDLSHFITAVAREQLWWAAGQLENLRRVVANLARLQHDFADGEVGDDPWFKLDVSLPDEALAPLRQTYVPLERAAMLGAARALIAHYRALAVPLAGAHGLVYPADLDRLLQARLARLLKIS